MRSKLRLNLTVASIGSVDMLAILNSFIKALAGPGLNGLANRSPSSAHCPGWVSIGMGAGLMLLAPGDGVLANSSFAARAEQVFLASRTLFQNQKTNAATAWQFGRACFDWADFAKDNEQRAQVAEEGIKACRRSLTLAPSLAAGHYYLAMNLGQLARTKSLGALKIVKEMEREFKLAIELDPRFDYAGPHRSLGLLYFEAPGWPTSIGSRSKARHHLEQAVELCPQFPENHLSLAEAHLRWNDKKVLDREVALLKELLPKARQTFSGDDWTQEWSDWEKRWAEIVASVDTDSASKRRH